MILNRIDAARVHENNVTIMMKRHSRTHQDCVHTNEKLMMTSNENGILRRCRRRRRRRRWW